MINEIDNILTRFQKKFDIVPRRPKDLEVIPTGYSEIDKALGIGGIPQGKTTEISGFPGTGKTLLAYSIISIAQKQGKLVLYLDIERNFSKEMAGKAGINLDELVICTPLTGEMAMDIIVYYVKNHYVDLIVMDSLAALIATSELQEAKGDYRVQERMIGILLKCIMDMIDNTDITLLCLNQIRMDLNLLKPTVPFNAFLGYYASTRIRLNRLQSIKKQRKLQGYKIEANIYKNNFSKREVTTFELKI